MNNKGVNKKTYKYFYFGLFEEDEEPLFTSLKIKIWVADVERKFTILGEKK